MNRLWSTYVVMFPITKRWKRWFDKWSMRWRKEQFLPSIQVCIFPQLPWASSSLRAGLTPLSFHRLMVRLFQWLRVQQLPPSNSNNSGAQSTPPVSPFAPLPPNEAIRYLAVEITQGINQGNRSTEHLLWGWSIKRQKLHLDLRSVMKYTGLVVRFWARFCF